MSGRRVSAVSDAFPSSQSKKSGHAARPAAAGDFPFVGAKY